MINTGIQEKITSFVTGIIQKWPEVFLIDVNISAGNKVNVLLDSDEGITIEKCIEVNRPLYKYLEENAVFGEENFSLEVSSPGIDRPLTSLRQYQKNIGRKVEVLLNDHNKIEGTLQEITDNEITVEEKAGKGKNLKIQNHKIPFDQIKHTTVQVTF